jgi:hypothetical protein
MSGASVTDGVLANRKTNQLSNEGMADDDFDDDFDDEWWKGILKTRHAQ